MDFTNTTNVPFPLACFLSYSDYDFIPDDTSISATTLLKPLRAIILQQQNPDIHYEADLIDMAASTMGSALHMWMEQALHNKYARQKAVEAMGMQLPPDPIVVNPANEAAIDGKIPVYCELRNTKKIGKWTISGKLDVVVDGKISDLKSTSAWAYVFGQPELDIATSLMTTYPMPMTVVDIMRLQLKCPKISKYILQLSIYRWLNPKIITDGVGSILYWFTDWSASNAKQKSDYPQQRCLSINVPLIDSESIEKFLLAKLQAFEYFQDKEQTEIPLCSSADLWQTDAKYKYYRKPTNKRATKVFTDRSEAEHRMAIDGGTGWIETVEGVAKACNYCAVHDICTQAKELQIAGLLAI
jgi:hypothetical protein